MGLSRVTLTETDEDPEELATINQRLLNLNEVKVKKQFKPRSTFTSMHDLS